MMLTVAENCRSTTLSTTDLTTDLGSKRWEFDNYPLSKGTVWINEINIKYIARSSSHCAVKTFFWRSNWQSVRRAWLFLHMADIGSLVGKWIHVLTYSIGHARTAVLITGNNRGQHGVRVSRAWWNETMICFHKSWFLTKLSVLLDLKPHMLICLVKWHQSQNKYDVHLPSASSH
jgi:hypothetical protein